jgi:pseudouridine kinase
MAILETITVDDLQRAWSTLAGAAWVFADCNLPAPVLAWLRGRRVGARFRLAVDAVSARKVMRLEGDLSGIDVLFLNMQEAVALTGGDGSESPLALVATLQGRGAESVVLTVGSDGLLVADGHHRVSLPSIKANVVDVTGAGDALIAGTLSRLLDGDKLAEAARTGLLAAVLTIESEESVNTAMSPELMERNAHRLAPLTKTRKKVQ